MFSPLSRFRQGLLPIDRHLSVAIPTYSAGDRRVETNLLLSFWYNAWRRFEGNCPDAARLQSVLQQAGEPKLSIDHVALRTFNLPNINRGKIGEIFERHGYLKVPETLTFPDKGLEANYFIHPNEHQPKVFISELLVEKVEPELQPLLWRVAGKARVEKLDDFLSPNWPAVRFEDYRLASNHSEYAGWVLAWGLQVNHFALFTNPLQKFAQLEDLNRLLASKSFLLNQSGGVIKGKETDLLRQSATISPMVSGRFSNGYHSIPGCFLEFAQRYPLDQGGCLFQGFRSSNANKIFESTNVQ